MSSSSDGSLLPVLQALGARPECLLGYGGEASVYAIDDQRIVRVLHDGQHSRTLASRQELLEELRSRSAPFQLPEVLEQGEIGGHSFTVERRLRGRSVMALLATIEGAARDQLIEHHLEAAAALGALHLERRGWFGELVTERPVRAATWRAFLRDRASISLRSATPEFRRIDPFALAEELPEPAAAGFVHLDAFAGNMLATGTLITAVLDFGATCVSGDPRLDPLATASYLSSPLITPARTPRDVDVAKSWLRSAGLLGWLEPARRWLAAYWSFAVNDPKLHEWCRSILLP